MLLADSGSNTKVGNRTTLKTTSSAKITRSPAAKTLQTHKCPSRRLSHNIDQVNRPVNYPHKIAITRPPVDQLRRAIVYRLQNIPKNRLPQCYYIRLRICSLLLAGCNNSRGKEDRAARPCSSSGPRRCCVFRNTLHSPNLKTQNRRCLTTPSYAHHL